MRSEAKDLGLGWEGHSPPSAPKLFDACGQKKIYLTENIVWDLDIF